MNTNNEKSQEEDGLNAASGPNQRTGRSSQGDREIEDAPSRKKRAR